MKRLSECFKGTYIYMSVHPEKLAKSLQTTNSFFWESKAASCAICWQNSTICVSQKHKECPES